MNEKIAIAVVLCALIGLSASQEINDEASGMDDPSVEELAVRLLQSPCLGGTELSEVQLLAGKLPDDMPIDLPLPDGVRIVGSEIVESDMQTGLGIDIVLEVPMTPDQTLDFYRGAMASRNWTKTMMNLCGMDRGFVQGDSGVIFCKGPDDPSLTVSAYPQENNTVLYISISSDPLYSPCSQTDISEDWLKPLPMLVAPKGVRQYNENSVSGVGSTAASASLETEMNSSSLAEHYADQMVSANWTMEGQGESGPSAWSTWSFVDEDGMEWNGFFIALDLPEGESQRFVMLQASME